MEGVPPDYKYEKIECMLLGVRDYCKFLKRGYARVSHLTSIDIRNGRLPREEAVSLVKKYQGKRPASLDYFLALLDIIEEEFNEILIRHVVSPHEFPESYVVYNIRLVMWRRILCGVTNPTDCI